jgi:ribonuclease T1
MVRPRQPGALRFIADKQAWLRWLLTALLAGAFLVHEVAPASAREQGPQSVVHVTELPPEARSTLQLIERGGPFPYRKDGSEFSNRERRLPLRARGYYREYTVSTPGERDRGARRIIAGGGGERYYSADHYRSFRRIVP